jgi:hypothetical protein
MRERKEEGKNRQYDKTTRAGTERREKEGKKIGKMRLGGYRSERREREENKHDQKQTGVNTIQLMSVHV